MAPFDPAREWLATQIRNRVIGDRPEDRTDAIVGGAGPRWFAEDRPIRVVRGDAAMFVGGLRALLLQSLHPRAMAGVADHSGYRADPWGRLQRTAAFLAATTFGSEDVAARAVRTVRVVHSRVTGTAPDGSPYSANDPHLLGWVHVAEVDSFLAAHQRYGLRRLSDEEADGYVADMAVIAARLGVVSPPTTRAELRAALATYRPELHGSAAARDAARFLLVDPPLPLAARPAYAALGAAAVGLLPAWARWPLRLPFLPVSETVLVRPAGELVTRLIRWSLQPAA